MDFLLYFERHRENTILRYLQIDKLVLAVRSPVLLIFFIFKLLQITDPLKGRHLVNQRAQKGIKRKKHEFYSKFEMFASKVFFINMSNM